MTNTPCFIAYEKDLVNSSINPLDFYEVKKYLKTPMRERERKLEQDLRQIAKINGADFALVTSKEDIGKFHYYRFNLYKTQTF